MLIYTPTTSNKRTKRVRAKKEVFFFERFFAAPARARARFVFAKQRAQMCHSLRQGRAKEKCRCGATQEPRRRRLELALVPRRAEWTSNNSVCERNFKRFGTEHSARPTHPEKEKKAEKGKRNTRKRMNSICFTYLRGILFCLQRA